MSIIKSNIANGLHSIAADHILTTADEIFDEVRLQYQEDINKSADTIEDNPEFLKIIVDSDNKLVAGIKKDGSLWAHKFAVMGRSNNPEYLYTIIDDDDHLLLALKRDGTLWAQKADFGQLNKSDIVHTLGKLKDKVVSQQAITEALNTKLSKDNIVLESGDATDLVMSLKAVKDLIIYNYEDNSEFIYAITDCNGKMLLALKRDGTWIYPKLQLTDVIENPEYLSATLDLSGIILEAIDRNFNHISNIKSEFNETAEFNKELNVLGDLKLGKLATTSLMDIIKSSGITLENVLDWSDSSSMLIELPKCAKLNIIYDGNLKTIGKASLYRTTSKYKGITYDVPVLVEFWDMLGNYFKKWTLMSAQGNSSLSFIKRNLAFDFYNSYEDAINDESAFDIKIGDWVTQSAYHMKAYYTDYFRGVGAIVYDLCEAATATLPIKNQRPYRYLHNTDAVSSIGEDTETDLDININYSPRCHPLGFPVIVYQNGKFWGVFAWQLKKHRDNFAMSKKNAKHIHLDGTLNSNTLFGGNISWTSFEVRNPKSLQYLNPLYIHCTEEDGVPTTKYDGDFPNEITACDTKTYIENLSKYVSNINYIKGNSSLSAALDDGIYEDGTLEAEVSRSLYLSATSLDERHEVVRNSLRKRFNVEHCIEFFLNANVTGDTDGFSKNWQWTTWDGVKWSPNTYDCDMALGHHFNGNRINPPASGFIGSSAYPMHLIYQYFLPEIKERYKELRDAKIYDATYITNLVKDWADRVGYDNYKSEYKQWPDSPCNRDPHVNSKYWSSENPVTKDVRGVSLAWNNTYSFTRGLLASYNNRIYIANANNTNLAPIIESVDDSNNTVYLVNSEYWIDITYDPEKEYQPYVRLLLDPNNSNSPEIYNADLIAAYSGTYNNTAIPLTEGMKFYCKQAHTGLVPVTKTYDSHPNLLGCYDSIERVHNYLVTRILNLDSKLDYVEYSVQDMANDIAFAQDEIVAVRELQRLLSGIQTQVEQLQAELAEYKDLTTTDINNIYDGLDITLGDLIDLLDNRTGKIAAINLKLDTINTNITALQNSINDHENRISSLEDLIEIWAGETELLIEALRGKASVESVEELEESVNGISESLFSETDGGIIPDIERTVTLLANRVDSNTTSIEELLQDMLTALEVIRSKADVSEVDSINDWIDNTGTVSTDVTDSENNTATYNLLYKQS